MQKYKFNPSKYKSELIGITEDLLKLDKITQKKITKVIKKHPKDGNKIFSKDKLIAGINWIFEQNLLAGLDKVEKDRLILKLKMKPTRTISGVTTVTVLTKPFACPGQCVFCPNDVRMPKSYIATEPGAQRALMNRFSPYLQVYNRLRALKNIGHPTDKIELLVLGGTWSYYFENYRFWFIKECFRAMNDFGEEKEMRIDDAETLTFLEMQQYLEHDYNDELRDETGVKPYNQLIQTEKFKTDFKKYIAAESQDEVSELYNQLMQEQKDNARGKCRCVGLVLETRPDTIDEEEVLRLRKLGATKVQLGIQTLDDRISKLNKRGETKADTSRAFNLLRQGGFKIHAHMMPNLYGATPELDLAVYKELFSNPNYKPDEVKIYPTSLIKNTELYNLHQEGKYEPYDVETLVELIANCMEATPEYCRLTRIIRDIPSTEIEAGNKTTNLRQVVEHRLKKENRKNPNIRAREIKGRKVKMSDLTLDVIEFETETSTEFFLQYVTNERLIAGFLRLSIPKNVKNPITDELDDCAIIREIHVYGPSLELSKDSTGEAQHLGLGTKLIDKAKEITMQNGFKKLAVISSIGTREYYDKRGFKLEDFYQIASF